MGRISSFKAHVLPFGVFMFLLGVTEIIAKVFAARGGLWASPQYLTFPLQTLLCGGLVAWFWSCSRFLRPLKLGFTLFIAVFVFAIWISPQELFHAPPRLHGFDPNRFHGNPVADFLTVSLRFLRLVVVVPLVEEIFWRGFLLRYMIDEDFEKVPFGAFSWSSFGVVAACFALAHSGPDFVPALATGALYNLVAYHTRSLTSCVVAHSLTNLLLGVYIMRTSQWGFW